MVSISFRSSWVKLYYSKQMTEIWKAYENREFSNLGRIRNPATGNILKDTPSTHGYRAVAVSGVTRSVHRCVWQAFNGAIPKGYEINHINHVKDDNRLINLELCTKQQNMDRAKEQGVIKIQENSPSVKLTNQQWRIIRHAVNWGASQSAVGRIFNISSSHISRVVNGLKRLHD